MKILGLPKEGREYECIWVTTDGRMAKGSTNSILVDKITYFPKARYVGKYYICLSMPLLLEHLSKEERAEILLFGLRTKNIYIHRDEYEEYNEQLPKIIK